MRVPGQRRTVELVVPVLNEEGNLGAFYDEVERVFRDKAPDVDWRVVFVDDGSRDRSWTLLTDLARRHGNVRALRLNHNYGAHVAISAGIQCADADAVVVLAADLQDPPAVVAEFVRRWDEGFKVVWGVRAGRKREAWHRKAFSRAFHWLVRRYALPAYPAQGTGSFCLVDRVVAANVRRMHEDFRTIFGLVAVQGYPAAEVPYVREERVRGQSGWSVARMIRTAIDVFTSYSHMPVRIITWIGLVSCALALLGIAYQLAVYTLYGSVRGWTMLFSAVCFFGGVQTLALGILGEYIWRTFHEVKRRPLWFVEDATFELEPPR
ncbi:MAG TPA: glycosyltransferase family 2 protein [Methylomirabilota bacterium]|nr:glycosyltransferase family 2 protein [Methylomirabilota bacterium]